MPGMIPTNPYDPNQYQQPSISGEDIARAWDVLKQAGIELGQNQTQFSGNVPPNAPPQYKAPMPRPKSDISPIPTQAQDFDAVNSQVPANQVPLGEDQAAAPTPNPVAAQDTVGEQAKTQELQPGNRRSIKEYLAQIRELRSQMAAQGVPEDQLPVPTFTNIQSGQMDQVQGYLGPGEGQAGPPQEVRSYMTPEYQAPADGGTPTQMGPAHPIQRILDQIKAQSPTIQSVMNSGALQNDMDPRWSMAVAFDTIDDWAKKVYDETGKPPTAKEANDAFNRLKVAAFKAQGENLAKYQKMFPGKEMQDFFKAFRTGNWGYVSKKGNDMLTQEKIGRVYDEARKRWDDMRDKENSAPLDDDGNPFPSQEAYIQYKVEQYTTGVQNMLKAAQGNQGTATQSPTGGPQTQPGSTGGPQDKSVGIAATPGGQLGAMAGNAVAGRKYQAPAAEGPAPTQTVGVGSKVDEAKKYYQSLIRQGMKDQEAQAKTREKFGK